jgi:hypothetical protein
VVTILVRDCHVNGGYDQGSHQHERDHQDDGRGAHDLQHAMLAGAQLTVPLLLAEALQLRELLEGLPKRSKFSYTTLPKEASFREGGFSAISLARVMRSSAELLSMTLLSTSSILPLVVRMPR